MSDESLGGVSGVEVPESQSSIPRRGKGILSVGRDDTVGNESVVSLQSTSRDTVVGIITGDLPYEKGLVSGSRDQEVWVLSRGCEGGDPSGVTFQSLEIR